MVYISTMSMNCNTPSVSVNLMNLRIILKFDNMEHKIGEIITLPDGRKAEVTATGSRLLKCSECVFWMEPPCIEFACYKEERSDKTAIYYKEIKEDE